MARNTFTRSPFGRAATVYTCDVCGRRTRNTGAQSTGSRLCPQCWDLAGIDNELSDGHAEPAERRDEVARLVAEVVTKGGLLGEWADLIDRVSGACEHGYAQGCRACDPDGAR